MNLLYSSIDNHFTCLYDNRIYDIRGDVTDITPIYDLYSWDDYENIDNLHYQNIVNCCILLTR